MAKSEYTQKWILILFGIYVHLCRAQEYDYQGCYYDFYYDRILKDLTECGDQSLICGTDACTTDTPYCESNGMTIEHCSSICREKNYQYFGLQAGGQCFCGGAFTTRNTWTPPTSSAEIARCNTPCSGNQFQQCGGDYLIIVYKFKGPLPGSICYHPGASIIAQDAPSTYTRVIQQPVENYNFNAGDTARYTCAQRGHKVIGLSTITCQSYSGVGAWTRGPPDGCTCCAVQCSIPSIPDGALQSGNYQSPYYEGDSIEYLCYETGATYTIMCVATGTGEPGAWTDIGDPCKPTTRAPSITKVPSTARPRPSVVTPICPNINCGFNCPYGFHQDHQGCYICQCKPSPVVTTAKPKTTRHVCQQIYCNMNCPYGLKVDTNGCTICECYYPPGVQRPPTKVSTTAKTKIHTDEMTDQYITATTFNISDNTTELDGGFEITIPKSTQTRPSIGSLPFIVGGVAFLGIIILLVFAVGCRQENFVMKGPPPPPPDYPTIDKKYYHYSVQRREVGLVYDTIELEKRKNKKNRKNSYVQNDIPDAPPPPTISQTVSKDQSPSIHSTGKSIKGSSHKSRSMQSLNRSEAASTGSRRPKNHSKSPSQRQLAKSKSKSRSTQGLSLDRSLAGGYRTPNSQTMSMSLPRGTRFIPIDTDGIDADSESYYAATIDRSTVSRSVAASDPQTLARSVSSEPFRSHRGKPIYNNTGTRSGQSTPRSKRRVKKGSETPNSYRRSKPSMPTTPTTPNSPRDSGFHGSMNIVLNSPLVGSHTSLLHQETPPPEKNRAKSMYVNLPERDHPMTASLDRLDMRTYANTSDDHLYMDPMEVRAADKPRLPYTRAVSTEVLSTPSRYQNRMRNMGPRLHINTRAPPRYGSQQHIPPDSPFGNMHLETTTPL